MVDEGEVTPEQVIKEITNEEIGVNWTLVDQTIDSIHKMLYSKESTLTLLEIDLVVYTIWTNTQKDKVVHLAMNDIMYNLNNKVRIAKEAAEVKAVKEPQPPGVG